MRVDEAVELIKDRIEGRTYGKEIAGLCPFCNSKEKKFYVNINTGQYSCKKGSCQAKGNATTLLRHLGIDGTIEYEDYTPSKASNSFTYDSSHITPITDDNTSIIDYMMSRGISVDTLRNSGIEYSSKHNAMVFKTFVNGEVKSVQYRTTDKRLFMERGSSQNLWGTEKLNMNNKTIYITEGVPDCLTLREMGVENAVSMPNGCANHSWIDSDWDLLNRFEKIVLCYDNDEPGKKGLSEVKNRLDFATIYELEYGDYKDVNDMYMGDSSIAYKTVENPKEISMDGFISLQNVASSKNPTATYHSSGLVQLDKIFGGFRLNESSLIVASSGVGKSTVIANILKGMMSTGEKVAIWSGELSNSTLKTWVYSAIAGENAIEKHENPFRPGDSITTIKKDYEEKINKAVDGKLFVYDGNKSNAFAMLNHFEKLHKRYGVKFFFIDNASILDMSVKGLGKYEGEEQFSQRLAAFTRNNGVHVFLIMHPTKTTLNSDPNYIDKNGKVKKPERFDQYQVRGSASIVNLAHNILFLVRASEHDRAWYMQQITTKLTKEGKLGDIPKFGKLIMEDLSLITYLVKNRGAGYVYEDAMFGYDRATRRVYGLMSREEDLSKEVLKEEEVATDDVIEIKDYDFSDF